MKRLARGLLSFVRDDDGMVMARVVNILLSYRRTPKHSREKQQDA